MALTMLSALDGVGRIAQATPPGAMSVRTRLPPPATLMIASAAEEDEALEEAVLLRHRLQGRVVLVAQAGRDVDAEELVVQGLGILARARQDRREVRDLAARGAEAELGGAILGAAPGVGGRPSPGCSRRAAGRCWSASASDRSASAWRSWLGVGGGAGGRRDRRRLARRGARACRGIGRRWA